jgi:hypothetical protein
METVKIKATHSSQGEFVIINKEDFDKDKHELYKETTKRVSKKDEK